MAKVLVTGTAGFIGYHLCCRLLESGFEVVGLDSINDYYDISLKEARLERSGISVSSLAYASPVQSRKNGKYRFLKLNLEDRPNLEKLFEEESFDYVVNLAAQAGVRYSLENPYAYVDSNIVGFLNILECCRRYPVRHLVYASSSSVYGNNEKFPFSEDDRVDYPLSMYAATKKSNELMAHTYSHIYKLPTTGLRFFTVYGPWGRPDMAPMLFAKAITEGKPIKVFNYGDMMRDFTYVDDIIEGLLKMIDCIPTGEEEHPYYRICNIGNSNPVQLMDFISAMEEAIGIKAVLEMYPMQQGDVKLTYADTGKIEKITGYKPHTPLKEGIFRFVHWYRAFYNTENAD